MARALGRSTLQRGTGADAGGRLIWNASAACLVDTSGGSQRTDGVFRCRTSNRRSSATNVFRICGHSTPPLPCRYGSCRRIRQVMVDAVKPRRGKGALLILRMREHGKHLQPPSCLCVGVSVNVEPWQPSVSVRCWSVVTMRILGRSDAWFIPASPSACSRRSAPVPLLSVAYVRLVRRSLTILCSALAEGT